MKKLILGIVAVGALLVAWIGKNRVDAAVSAVATGLFPAVVIIAVTAVVVVWRIPSDLTSRLPTEMLVPDDFWETLETADDSDGT